MNQFLRQLPRYRCHKEVSALKIADIVPNPRGYELHFEDQRFAPHQVPDEWVNRHLPSPGGYFVIYDDGYQSWSPAQPFESGYHLIETADGAAPSMDFGEALRALKAGRRVARAGWNGKGMFLFLIQGSNDIAKLHGYGFGELVGEPAFRDAIFMKTVDNQLVPWTASQTDCLADDWQIVE